MMNIAGWFVPGIAHRKRLILAMATPFASRVTRKVKFSLFDSYDNFPTPQSLDIPKGIKLIHESGERLEYSLDSSEFSLDLHNASSHAGAASPPRVEFRSDVAFFNRLSKSSISIADYTTLAFSAFDDTGTCFFALANADIAFENRWASLYGMYPKQRMSCQKHIDYFRWYDILNGPQDQIRGIYWGTFIGPKLAKRLPRSIVDDFNALADPYAGSPQRAAWLPKGSVYFLLNDDPRVNYDESIEPPTGLENMYTNCGVWLARQLHAAGIY